MRPNILIDDGGELGEEDDWLGCHLRIDTEVIVHAVPRCVMATLAQSDLPRDLGVLKAIARVGRRQLSPLGQVACAGSYATVIRPGVVRTGDPIGIERVESAEEALAAMIAAPPAGGADRP